MAIEEHPKENCEDRDGSMYLCTYITCKRIYLTLIGEGASAHHGAHLSSFEGDPPLFLIPFLVHRACCSVSFCLVSYLPPRSGWGYQDYKCAPLCPVFMGALEGGVQLWSLGSLMSTFIQKVISLTYIFYLIRFSLVAVSLLSGSLLR